MWIITRYLERSRRVATDNVKTVNAIIPDSYDGVSENVIFPSWKRNFNNSSDSDPISPPLLKFPLWVFVTAKQQFMVGRSSNRDRSLSRRLRRLFAVLPTRTALFPARELTRVKIRSQVCQVERQRRCERIIFRQSEFNSGDTLMNLSSHAVWLSFFNYGAVDSPFSRDTIGSYSDARIPEGPC